MSDALPAFARILELADGPEAAAFAATVASFLDTSGTSMGRATFYNSRAEQEAAEERAHAAAFAADRTLYGVLAALPGTTDRTRGRCVRTLLAAPVPDGTPPEAVELETRILSHLVSGLTPPRRLRLFTDLRAARVNNARTRRVILTQCLDSPKLELWAVRYRSKLRAALRHAWGNRAAGILRSVLAKDPTAWTDEERDMVRDRIDRHHGQAPAMVRESVAFVLGSERVWTRRLFQAFVQARGDLEAGAILPPEVLEGIRSTFHPEVKPGRVLEIAKAQLTTGQKIAVQRTAEKAGVEVAFDPRDYDPVRLYLYALERGMTDEIGAALDAKAQAAAKKWPFRYGTVGILIDASASMTGHRTQRLRPMATALALRDVLQAVAESATVRVSGGISEGRLIVPEGHTDLAADLVELLRTTDVETVFVLSDGYENAPAGRVAEVLAAARAIGCTTPVMQLSPVMAAEADGLRALAPNQAPALPVNRPEGLGLTLVRGLLDVAPRRALEALLGTIPAALTSPAAPRIPATDGGDA